MGALPSEPAPAGSVEFRSADGTVELLRRALPLMSRHAAGYAPDSYALWFEYVRGANPALRAELDALVARVQRLSHELTDELHRRHLGTGADATVQAAGAGLLELMHAVGASVEAASADASAFDAQLAAFDEGLARADSADDVRRRVDAMRDDVGRMNRTLGALTDRLDASRREVERLNDELCRARDEASLDPLSGVLNRRGFDATLERLCEDARAGGEPLCLVMVDIDHFKQVNDTWGHPIGDQVIRGVGQALSLLTQRKDQAARYGGEEFALLMPATTLDDARRAAERLRNAIASSRIKRAEDEAPVGSVTVSAGVARLMAGESPAAFVARADRALYASKQGGRNRVTVDPS